MICWEQQTEIITSDEAPSDFSRRLADQSSPFLLFQAALRQITDKAREFGAGPLFNQILPLLMSPTLEDQERHLLVKVIDRILYKLDDLVRPYVHKVGCV